MKELDCVEILVEKEKYAKHGVHKGMQGWICFGDCIDGYWLVNIPQYGEKDDIAEINIKEDDLLLLLKGMDANINEKIRKQYVGK